MFKTLSALSLGLLMTASFAATEKTKVLPATNTKCPVMGGAVDKKSSTVTVRGHEYRLCCPACSDKLKAEPDKYLEKDGTPKNAIK